MLFLWYTLDGDNMKYRCKICGFVKVEEMETNFLCPECGSDKKNFINETIDKRVWISEVNPSIVRINKKCINCGMCKNTCENKTGIKYNREEVIGPICINCGQCILSCPTGALIPKYDYGKVLEYLSDKNYTVIVSIAPSVRVALGDEFGFEPGSLVTNKIVSSLRELGFDYVFDTCYGADLTIMEEATELIERLKSKKNLPQFTSCCPAWVKYCEIYHEELLPHISTTKSPISMQGAIIKSYLCDKKEFDTDKIINVTIAPCTAKKYEIRREELQGNDFVLTTSELAIMLRERNIDFNSLSDSEFDKSLSESTGAANIFGNSGGVMEAALRTAYYLVTNEEAPSKFLEFREVRGLQSIKEANVNILDNEFKVAVIYGMPNFESLLPRLKEYVFIEVMNCEGGCIAGGGQPLVPIAKMNEYKEKRMENLYSIDNDKTKKSSYENKEIKQLYNDYLKKPGSVKAKRILHTTYKTKKDLLQSK